RPSSALIPYTTLFRSDVGAPGLDDGLVQAGHGVEGDLVALAALGGLDRLGPGDLPAGDGDADLHRSVLGLLGVPGEGAVLQGLRDRKSTRLNSSHVKI